MVWTKWHGQNGTDELLRIKSSINPALIENMIFSSIPLSLRRHQLSSMCLSFICNFWLLDIILNSTELRCTQNIKLYHSVHTILSVPFCPLPFCPVTHGIGLY